MGKFTSRILGPRILGRGRRAVASQELFRCFACGRSDYFAVGALPVCCDQSMRSGGVEHRGGDPEAVRLDRVQVWPQTRATRMGALVAPTPPDVHWAAEGTPETIWELWQFRPGRQKGERIGWIGARRLGYEYRMVPGIPLSRSRGFGTDLDEVTAEMFAKINA